ncbi:MAG: DUF4298 domain-containing protein [Streptococcus sp.]|nr:DUF4298 domain-containing protein [Streptococcus sp.]
MNSKDQLRLAELEEKYNTFKPKLDQLAESLEDFKKHYDDYTELRAFYGGEEWFRFTDQPIVENRTPILGEDLLYNFIREHNDLLTEFLELSAKMYKNS